MSVRQLVFLGIALLAAVAALVVVRGAMNQPSSVAVPAPEGPTGPQVLVAAKDLAPGEAATPDALAWVAWPEDGLNAAFVAQETAPKAIEEFTGAVARGGILKGEPIRADRLIRRGQQGFFAAVVQPGYRAVALPITDETAAAGFIVPSDRVDVILTRKLTISRGSDSYEEVRSDAVLENVKVLSIGEQLSDPNAAGGPPKRLEGSVATLELSPRDAETLAMADELGDLSLALRGVEDDAAAGAVLSARRRGARALEQFVEEDTGNVRVHAFGSVSEAKVTGNGNRGFLP
jgi:pilus assembly protein CpaB